ncbi:hypothetical protein [Shewanella glacialipiscicola]|uniref:hypothetical protein n=1 Tax=Shewanella glacialipiscicola TaxID=614069 RepID=UPI003D79CBA0
MPRSELGCAWGFGFAVALGIGKQERSATASLLAISGSRYRGERSEKPDRQGTPKFISWV